VHYDLHRREVCCCDVHKQMKPEEDTHDESDYGDFDIEDFSFDIIGSNGQFSMEDSLLGTFHEMPLDVIAEEAPAAANGLQDGTSETLSK